jgi:hypothetical protein
MKNTILIFLSFLLLASCSGNSIFDGQPIQEEKGEPGLFSKDSKKGISLNDFISGKDDSPNLNLNAYLWRASLNVLSIAPLISTDALGGTIITDWYVNKNINKQRIKITALIKTSELRSDGIEIKVHLQEKKKGVWSNTVRNKSLETQIENQILNEARNLRINSVK